ncbi:MAG: MFS transporter, partial [Caldilineae bacterium]
PWQELIATVIPVSHRGRYWGISLILGKVMGMAGAVVTGFLLTRVPYPTNYAAMFGLGFLATSISLLFTNLTVEPVIDRSAIREEQESKLWQKVGAILKTDRNFLYFLLNRAAAFLSTMGMGFVAVFGIQKFDLPLSYSAVLTFTMLAAEIAGYSLWGYYGDKRGYKRILEFSHLSLALGLALLLLVPSIWAFYLAFALVSLAHAGEYIADQNIAMEFGTDADRPTYIGMSKTLTGPFLLVSPVIGGTLVEVWGYESMFSLSLAIALIAYALIRFLVVEPRLTNGTANPGT